MKLISLSPFISLILMPILVLPPVYGQLPAPAANGPAAEAAAGQMLQLRVSNTGDSQAATGSRTAKGFAVQAIDAAGAPVADAAITFRLPDDGATGVFADGRHSAVVYTDAAGYASAGGIQWGETPGPVAIRVTATKGISHAGTLIQQTLISATASATPVSSPLRSSTTVMVEPATPRLPQPATQTDAKSDRTPRDLPVAHSSATPDTTPQPEKSVSVTSASPAEAPHRSHAKWFVIAAIAAGAGVGVAMAGKGKSGTAASSTPSLSIGAPTVSVGQPH